MARIVVVPIILALIFYPSIPEAEPHPPDIPPNWLKVSEHTGLTFYLPEEFKSPYYAIVDSEACLFDSPYISLQCRWIGAVEKPPEGDVYTTHERVIVDGKEGLLTTRWYPGQDRFGKVEMILQRMQTDRLGWKATASTYNQDLARDLRRILTSVRFNLPRHAPESAHGHA